MVGHAIIDASIRDAKDGIGHFHKKSNVSAKWMNSLNIQFRL
jgi:hypothetical protein